MAGARQPNADRPRRRLASLQRRAATQLRVAPRLGADGEPAWQFDCGRVADTFTAAVHKWNMAVFTSAGNDGPALSSLGSPGSLTAPITVGAWVSPQMILSISSAATSRNAQTDLAPMKR